MKEIFKQIPDYPNYEASNLGSIKSLKRGNEKILKPTLDDVGYYFVTLWEKGNRKFHRVHQLVAMAFLNHKPCKYKLVVDHIDNNPLNNRLNNLQVITNRENLRKDKIDVGVCWDKNREKWISRVNINGKNKFLGRYVNKQDALNAYQNELNKL